MSNKKNQNRNWEFVIFLETKDKVQSVEHIISTPFLIV